jgi:putative two-component system response regulator
MPNSKLTLVNQRTSRTPATLGAAQTPLNQRALNTLQAVRAWEQFEQRLSDDDRALLGRISMGDCIKSASNHVGMTYANAQRRLLRLQERMGVRSLPLLIWVWRTVTQPDHAERAEQTARNATPTLVEHARDVARFVKSKPDHHDADALHHANINNDDLITLLESRMRDGDTAAMSEFVVSVSMSLPSLLSSSEADFEMAVRAARVIAAMEKPEPVATAIHVLLDVSAAHAAFGRGAETMDLIASAFISARDPSLISERRRCFNVASLVSVSTGLSVAALEYAFQAMKISIETHDTMGVSSAMANMTAALFSMGLYEETIFIANLLIDRCGADENCKSFIALAQANIGNAALASRNFKLGVKFAQEGSRGLHLPRNHHEILNLVIAEGIWLKYAIALEQGDVALARLRVIREVADSIQTPRIELNRKLAEAAYEIYVGHLTLAVTKLVALKEQTKAMPTLFRDNLELLIDAHHRGGDSAGALQYQIELVEFLGVSQVTKTRDLMRFVNQQANPLVRVNQTVRSIVEGVQYDICPRASIEAPESMYRETFERLALSAELRDDIDTENLGRHAYRVGALAGLLAARAGHDDHFVQSVELSARLHDVGKLCIPENILTKTEKLTDAEFAAIQRHTSVGAQILSQCRHPAFRMAEDIALHHHEKWDGSGYPHGLKGDAIPEAARIVALADVYDTLTHVRPYKRAWTHKAAITEIQKLSGTHFDPTLVDQFVPMLNQLRKKFPGAAFDKHLSKAGEESEFLQARDRIHEMLAETEALLVSP